MDFDANDMQERKFRLKVQVKVVEMSYQDHTKRQMVDKVVLLLPRMDDGQTIEFMTAWLPNVQPEKATELLGAIGGPYFLNVRFAVFRQSKMCPNQPYLYLMTHDAETVLKTQDKKWIHLLVMPKSYEYNQVMGGKADSDHG